MSTSGETIRVPAQAIAVSDEDGQRRLSFSVIGKHPQSRAYRFGIDAIELVERGRRTLDRDAIAP